MSGDLLVVDAEDLKNNPASETHVQRFKSEVEAQNVKGQHLFHCADGSLRQEGSSNHSPPTAASSAGGDAWRTSDPEKERTEDVSTEANKGSGSRIRYLEHLWNLYMYIHIYLGSCRSKKKAFMFQRTGFLSQGDILTYARKLKNNSGCRAREKRG